MRIALLILVVALACLAGIGLWWLNSPLYAFQEAALAFKNNDQSTFDSRVASRDIAEHLIDDLLVEPASATPNLSMLQQSVAAGALVMAKNSLVAGMMDSIQKSMQANGRSVSFLFFSPALAESGRHQRRDASGGP